MSFGGFRFDQHTLTIEGMPRTFPIGSWPCGLTTPIPLRRRRTAESPCTCTAESWWCWRWRPVHRHFFVTQLSHLFCARMRQEYDDPAGEQSDRLTVEPVRSAMNTWLSAADLKPAPRQACYKQELKKQRYYQRRNKQARKSHTKTRITRLHELRIDVDRIKSCITERHDDEIRCFPPKVYSQK